MERYNILRQIDSDGFLLEVRWASGEEAFYLVSASGEVYHQVPFARRDDYLSLVMDNLFEPADSQVSITPIVLCKHYRATPTGRQLIKEAQSLDNAAHR